MQKDEAPVRQVAGRCEAELASWGRLQQELEALAGVGDSVDTLRAEMEALCGQLQTLDTSLDQHLEAREDRDMWLWKGELQRDTDMFEGARVREVKMLERQLKAEMAKKARMKAAVSPHAAPLARPQGSARAEQLPEGSHAPAIASVQPEENQKHAATSEGSSAENAQEDCKVSVSAPAVAKGEHGVEKDDEGSKPAPEDTTSNSEGQNQAQEKKEAAEVATRAKESTVEEGKQAVKASKLEGESKAEREEKTDT